MGASAIFSTLSLLTDQLMALEPGSYFLSHRVEGAAVLDVLSAIEERSGSLCLREGRVATPYTALVVNSEQVCD
jgi:hypothetical protein